MKRFSLGVLEVVVASIIVNIIYNWTWEPKVQSAIPDLSYPTPQIVEKTKPILAATLTSKQTVTSWEIRISTDWNYVWKNLDELEAYENKEFSSIYIGID